MLPSATFERLAGRFPAPIQNRDVAGCWMNNIRDMINLQNWFYLKRTEYSTDWTDSCFQRVKKCEESGPTPEDVGPPCAIG